jgi:hypothetical protein
MTGPARDLKLARAVLQLVEAAGLAQDLIDQAEYGEGWGKGEDGEDWPKDRPTKVLTAVTRALNAVQQALKEGDYWADPDDDEGDELRDD